MDLPFLSGVMYSTGKEVVSFNPYSNGSSFFIIDEDAEDGMDVMGFNPYSNGSSFFIPAPAICEYMLVFRFNPYSNGSSFFIVLFLIDKEISKKFQSLF